MKIYFSVIFLLLISSFGIANANESCTSEDEIMALKFSQEIISAFQNKDLNKISEISNIIYGDGNINSHSLEGKSFDEVFDNQWAEQTFKNIEPFCERHGYDGYYLGGGIWFEFLYENDDKCQSYQVPKIIALNEGVKNEYKTSEVIEEKEIELQYLKCLSPVLAIIINNESLKLPDFNCVYDRFEDGIFAGGDEIDAMWECTAKINKDKINELIEEDGRIFERYIYSVKDNIEKYFND